MATRKPKQELSLRISRPPVEKLWKPVENSENSSALSMLARLTGIGGLMFSIPGRVIARGSGISKHFKPFDERTYQEAIGWCAKSAARANGGDWCKKWIPMDGRIVFGIVVYRNAAPTTKPDLSNYLKMAEDALTGIIYKDDAQIVEYFPGTRKENSPTEAMRVIVAPQMALEILGLEAFRGI